MKTVIEMAREAGFNNPVRADGYMGLAYDRREGGETGGSLERFAELVRADERKEIDRKIEELARKWWKIHCDSNLHYSSTLKAHQDFCALQAAIRARSNT